MTHSDDGDSAAFSVLTVCTANVCRSASSARALSRLLDDLADAEGRPVRVLVASAGVDAIVGEPRCEIAHQLLDARLGGGETSGQPVAVHDDAATISPPAQHLNPGDLGQSQALTAEMVDRADLILTASRRHSAAVVSTRPQARTKVQTWRQAAGLSSWVISDEGSLSVARQPWTATSFPSHDLRASTPALPADAQGRLRWWVEEMDASRGAGAHSIDPAHPEVDPADIPDPHLDPAVGHDYPSQLMARAITDVVQAVRTIVASEPAVPPIRTSG